MTPSGAETGGGLPGPGRSDAEQDLWERWAELDPLFEAALDLPPEERDAFLVQACGGDEELLHTIRRLLEWVDSATDRFEQLPSSLLRAALGGEPEIVETGRQVGRYRLGTVLGRGGMATVYEAVRDDGVFDQRVAVKLLRRGLDTDEVVRRFTAERRILSSLEHPNIARVIDGGATDDGRPFLVMERVDGEPITKWADRRRLTVRERLALFLQVADAVQFAHGRLIVHRDLKPSNILVDDDGRVRLLDFGIAKLLDSPGDDETLTRTGVRPLTPAYASPEQIRGDPVTTASDVYQLGVLLYVLLAGRRPFLQRGAELEEAITTGRYPKPSDVAVMTRAPDSPRHAEATGAEPTESTEPMSPDAVASARGTTPDALRRTLRGDLDAIVLKALRVEPERRYASASELAADVQRFLDRQPVLARPDTWAYRARRFAARRPALASSGLLLVAMTVAYLATVQRHAKRLEVERDRASLASEKAQQVSDFVVALFESNDPDATGGEVPSVFELLERGERRADALAEQPPVQAQMLNVIARMYTKLGQYDRAEPLFRRALALRRNIEPLPHAELATTLDELGDVLQRTGRYGEAEPLLLEAAQAARLAGDRSLESDAHTDLGHTRLGSGDYTGAEAAYRTALAMRIEALGERHERTAIARHNLALALEAQERYDEAEALYLEALAAERDVLDPDHSDIALTLTTLARLYSKTGRFDAAEPLLREALEISRRRLGPKHVRLGLTLSELGIVAVRRGDLDAAEAYFRESLEIQEAALGPSHPEIATALNNLSYVFIEQGRLREALPLRRRTVAIARAALGNDHRNVGFFLHNLGDVLQRLEQFEEAEDAFREAVQILERTLPPDHDQLRRTRARLDSLTARNARGVRNPR